MTLYFINNNSIQKHLNIQPTVGYKLHLLIGLQSQGHLLLLP